MYFTKLRPVNVNLDERFAGSNYLRQYMHIKDYYSILQVQPSATLPEIKKAYRLLAQQFHPDKNHNDPYAAAQFVEIKEAYEVLTNPSKKEYYLQQRWYNQSIGKRKTQDIITPVTVLKQVLELDRYVAGLDVFRMDKNGLQEYIIEILNDSAIEKLNTFNDVSVNKEIIQLALNSIKPLPFSLLPPIEERLLKINTDPQTTFLISDYIIKREKNNAKKRQEIWIVLLITIAICLLIYFLN